MNTVMDSVPEAHLRGISRIVLVDRIEEPRVNPAQREDLPGLYHPRMPGNAPWLEIALFPLRFDKSMMKRIGRRLTFRANITATLLSLIAQHYYLTLSHGIKRDQFEAAVRSYVEKQYTAYTGSKKGVWVGLMKPFKPALEKFAKWLQKRYQTEMKKQAGTRAQPKPAKQSRRPRR